MTVTAFAAVVTRELAGRRDFLALAASDPARYPCLLESVTPGPATARHDLLFVHDGEAIVAPAHGDDASPRFLDALDDAWRKHRVERARGGPPFRGGWVLMLTYELAAECEPRLRLPPPPVAIPRAIALRAPAAAIYDHRRDVTVLVAETSHAHWLDTLEAALQPITDVSIDRTQATALCEDDAARYLEGVARVHEYLAAGDVFQVNLSRAWQADLHGVAVADVYRRLRASNPAPFAGLFRFGDHAMLSSSPERLVRVRGGIVETRPIAGTRPRAAGAADDAERVRELVGHPKERAEHIMLIDLERNDLGRVCEPGSVEVDELMTVESYAHVHHIVSNVRGRLRAGVTPGQVIRATFPGGTITGCPKVRCMEIIAALEGEGRGPYTGAFGYLDNDGEMDLNILIRTIWLHNGVARIRAGSGIVMDSVPERELDETRAKARGMLRALDPS
jgi:anthranilate synthase component I